MKKQIQQLVDADGQVHLGHFDKPVNKVNGKDFDFRTVMNKQTNALRKHFSYKQFQYFGAIGEDLIFGCAFADIRYVGACFVYVFRPSDQKMQTWQFKLPLALGLTMSDRTDNGASRFSKGKKTASQRYILNKDGTRKKHLLIDFGPELQIDAWMDEPASYQTQSLCTPSAVNGWVYAQKTAALPVQGTIECALGQINLSDIGCYGHHDFSAGYMRRDTFWNWACFSLPPSKKRPALGLNISWGVNETGYTENCIWLGNECIELPQVQFDYSRDHMLGEWRALSRDGSVDLRFQPVGKHSEELNLLILATNFHQLFGQFEGTIKIPGQNDIVLDGVWGFVEHQFSRW